MTPRVEWGTLMPAEVRAAAEPIVARWLHVTPSWCHVLKFYWDDAADVPGGDGCPTSMYCTARPPYREAAVWFGPVWLGLSPEERDATVRHELAHLPNAALDDLFGRLLKQIKKLNPTLHDDYTEQWRQAHEGATCDIAASYAARPAA